MDEKPKPSAASDPAEKAFGAFHNMKRIDRREFLTFGAGMAAGLLGLGVGLEAAAGGLRASSASAESAPGRSPHLDRGAGWKRPFVGPRRWVWRLAVTGDVSEPRIFDLHDLLALPSRVVTARLTSAEGQSVQATWEGIHMSTIVDLVAPRTGARYVYFRCADGYVECLPIAELLRPRALLAHTRNWELVPGHLGGPLRVVIPWKYTYKNPCAVTEIAFSSRRIDGTWTRLHPEWGWDGTIETSLELEKSVGFESGRVDPQIETAPQQLLRNGEPRWPNPGVEPDAAKINDYIRGLNDPSFTLANSLRDLLIQLGPAAIAAFDPQSQITPSPLHHPGAHVRMYAYNILGEVECPESTQWLGDGLRDPQGEIIAYCLEALALRGVSQVLGFALAMIDHPSDPLALSAVASVERLAEAGQGSVLERLHEALEATDDPIRLAYLERAIRHLGA